MNWLVFIFALEAGIFPDYSLAMYEPPQPLIVADWSLYTQFEATVEMRGFFIGGALTSYAWRDTDGLYFWPFQMTSRFDAGWRRDWVTIGFRHICEHPVIPHAAMVPKVQHYWERAYQQIYIRFEGEIK